MRSINAQIKIDRAVVMTLIKKRQFVQAASRLKKRQHLGLGMIPREMQRLGLGVIVHRR